jgi:hypothetical protein
MTASKTVSNKAQTVAKPTMNIARLYPLIIILVTFLVYSRATHYQFVGMDENDLIVQNSVFIKHLKNLPQAFKQSVFEIPGQYAENKLYYRPILIVSLMMEAQIHSKDIATPYHIFNILYHLIACMLLYFLLKKLCKNPELSMVLTLIFAIHPINEYAVAWILGRNDILLSIFILLSLHGLIDYYKTKNPKFLALHLSAFALAVFTKESGVLMLLLYFLFMLLWQKDIKFYLRNKIIILGYIIIAGGWFLARWSVMHGHDGSLSNDSIIQIVLHNMPYLILYIGKIILPFNMNVMPGVDSTAIILGTISLLAFAVLFYFIKDKGKAIYSAIWFFLFLAPTLVVPDLPAYEHRDYLPFIGIIIGVSQVSFLKNFRFTAQSSTYLLLGIITLFIIITSIRLPIYENELAFNEDGTENTPFAAGACINMANIFMDGFHQTKTKESLNKAGDWAMRGLREDSTILQGNNMYGTFLFYKGDPDQAAIYFQKEIKFHPLNSEPYKNMAIYYQQKNQTDISVTYWKKLINLNKYFLDAYWNLSNYYKQIGDSVNAHKYLNEGQELSDENQAKIDNLKR